MASGYFNTTSPFFPACLHSPSVDRSRASREGSFPVSRTSANCRGEARVRIKETYGVIVHDKDLTFAESERFGMKPTFFLQHPTNVLFCSLASRPICKSITLNSPLWNCLSRRLGRKWLLSSQSLILLSCGASANDHSLASTPAMTNKAPVDVMLAAKANWQSSLQSQDTSIGFPFLGPSWDRKRKGKPNCIIAPGSFRQGTVCLRSSQTMLRGLLHACGILACNSLVCQHQCDNLLWYSGANGSGAGWNNTSLNTCSNLAKIPFA